MISENALTIDTIEIDYETAAPLAATRTANNAVKASIQAPDPGAWRDMLNWCAQAIPPPRAAALAGLRWPKVKAWLHVNADAQNELTAVRAQVTAKLVGVVWNEAINEDNWKAALSLLRHVDPTFNPAPKKQKVEVNHNTQINTQTAQVIAGSSTEDLMRVLGLEK